MPGTLRSGCSVLTYRKSREDNDNKGWSTHRTIGMTLSNNLSVDGVVPVVENIPEMQVRHDISQCTHITMQDAPLAVCHLVDYSSSSAAYEER